VSEGKRILELYDDYQVTLSPLGPVTTNEVKWVDTAVHANLRSAARQIIREENKRAPYMIMVHQPGKDTELSWNEISAVVQEVSQTP